MLEEDNRKAKREREEREKCEIECQICLVEIDMMDVGTIECGHIFHRACLSEHVKALIEANKLDMTCPMEECGHALNVMDIK